MSGRTLLVVSARCAEARAAVAAGRWPRKDFLELARALDADVLDLDALPSLSLRLLAGKPAGVALAQAALAWARRGAYTHIFSDGEHIGLPLAALLVRSRVRPRHTCIGHLLSTRAKRLFARTLHPADGLDLVVVHATAQIAAAHALGFAPEQIRLVAYGVDAAFWSPRGVPGGDALICSAGLEYRDHETLVRAAADLPVRVAIAAGSRWSRHRGPGRAPVPENVTMTRLDYAALRDLYAAARFVVVPLREVENQAGVTTLLEAMAMGKAVIVSATRGQRDLVRGRLWTAAGPTAMMLGDPTVFGVDRATAAMETGIYVPPHDPAALRTAIAYLLAHPERAESLGRAGRALIERWMTLERYVGALAEVTRGERRDALAPHRSVPKADAAGCVPVSLCSSPACSGKGGDRSEPG